MNLIKEIKKKREFSQLPDSIIERVANLSKGDIKKSRALLRKYFGVFLTNRVLKGKEDVLSLHFSSKKRNYEKFYGEIFSGLGDFDSVIDLGCGVNGFSYEYLQNVLGDFDYIGVEAAGQLVRLMNNYFEINGFFAKTIVEDLFDIKKVVKILKVAKKRRVVFLFQVLDAFENLEKNFSKKFILNISKESEAIVLSLPTESLGGRKKFDIRRKWIVDFLKENFNIKKDFSLNGERILIFVKKGI